MLMLVLGLFVVQTVTEFCMCMCVCTVCMYLCMYVFTHVPLRVCSAHVYVLWLVYACMYALTDVYVCLNPLVCLCVQDLNQNKFIKDVDCCIKCGYSPEIIVCDGTSKKIKKEYLPQDFCG